jgi:hypothetical protein
MLYCGHLLFRSTSVDIRLYCRDLYINIFFTSDLPWLYTDVMLILKCFSTVFSFSYPYPTKWGRYNMFSCCDKDSAFIFTTGRLPDVTLLETGVGANDCKCSR